MNLMELEKIHKNAYHQVHDNAYLKEPLNEEILSLMKKMKKPSNYKDH